MIAEPFAITIDTSSCKSVVTGYDEALNDTWYYCDLSLESGKIYGLVSEHGQGCEFLSYFLGGRISFDNVKVYFNGNLISQSRLNEIGWNLEPLRESYGNKVVKKAILHALKNEANETKLQDIAEKFLLTPERSSRKFNRLSGERWRAAAALGYAQNKRIFFAPYNTSNFYYQMCRSSLLKCLRELTESGAMVVLPCGSDAFIKHIADEIIYLDREFDIKELQTFYSKQ
ncbi:MAG: hypothetical protein NC299_09140 [Lachnospiraceae bacterium]|nr:hypothetical protein [Ruminococcus sp.]MCM1275517.1 hypothetical protein [Lachnospiraceae bacterium]